MIFETVFEKWAKQIRDAFLNADWNLVWAWILIALGILCFFVIILFTEFKRKERDSVRFTAIMAGITALLLGFGLHLLLVSRGLW